MTRAILLILTVIIFMAGNCYAGQWLWHHNEEIKGQVVESDTLKPIEGALIIAIWKLEDVINEGPGGYERVEVAKSDREGNFVVPSWFSFKPWQLLYKIEKNAPFVLIFKPGYKIVHSNRAAREGFPDDTSISEKGKRVIKQRYGLNPVKLDKISNDKERIDSLEELMWVRFPGRHFSKKQMEMVFERYEDELNNLSEAFADKDKIIKNACDRKVFYVGGKCED